MATSFRRWVEETVVIVVGVLIALGAESAWSASQDRRKAEDYRRQILDEVATVEQDIAQALATEQDVLNHADRFREGLGGRAPASADSLGSWLSGMFRSSLFSPSLPTVSALVSTGDLRLMERGEMRNAVVEIHQASAAHARTADIQDALLVEASQMIGERLDLGSLFGTDAERGRGLAEVAWVELAADPAFRSEVFHVENAARNRTRALREFQQRLEILKETLGPLR